MQPVDPRTTLNGVFIPFWLLHRSDISPAAKITYAILATHLDSKGRTREEPAVIAGILGTNLQQFKQYVTELVKAGLIERQDSCIIFRPIALEVCAMEAVISIPATTELSKQDRPGTPTRVPENYVPTDRNIRDIKKLYAHIDISIETEKFINYWLSRGDKGSFKMNWDRMWRNWMHNAGQWRKDTTKTGDFNDTINSFR